MAENAASASPNKILVQPPPGGGGGGVGDASAAPPNPQHPSLPSSQLPPSPSMAGSDLTQIASPQLPQPQSQAALDYSKQQATQPQQQQQQQQQQQMQNQQQQKQTPQQNLLPPSSNFQMEQNLQRSGSMPRLAQIQQQLGAGAMRQHAGMYSGQMNFGGSQIQQQQQQQQHLAAAAAAAGIARSGMITQAGQLPMVAGQTAQHFNLQSQLLAQPRQKSLVQGAQFNAANSSGQTMQGMQNMGVMGTLGLNPQLRANGPMSYSQQRFVQGQMRQQQLSQQMALASPQKLPGQSLPRTSSAAGLNSQVSGLTQNGQSTLVQNALSQQQQQQWLKHLQPSLSSPVSPSYHLQQQQRQQQSFLPQQLASSQLHSKSMALTQQQISQLVQQQPQLSNQQQQQQQHLLQQQQLQHFQQLHQQQLQSPRLPGPGAQKSLSQQETPASSGTAMPSGSSSQGTEPTNQLLGKRKIHDLVLQVDPLGKLDPEVEDLLLEIADDFIDSVTSFACNLAKHRKSSTLEAKDVLLHLEKNWKLTIPGYTREEKNYAQKALPLDIHKKRLEMIGDFAEPHQSEGDVGVSKVSNKQVLNNLGSDHSLRPSPSSEQLSLPVVGSQIMHKQQRF